MRKSLHQTLSILAICLLLSQTIFGSLPVFAQTNSDALTITMTENGQTYTEGSVATSPVTIQVVTTSPDSAGIELSQDLGTTWKPYDTAVLLVLEDAGNHDIWFRLTDSDGQAVIEKRHIQITTAALLSRQATGPVIYVDANSTAANGGDGTSWATAYKDLQAALSAAGAGQEIWIAAGTYKPTSLTDRTISFQMKNGVKIYGGFVGDETTAAERDFEKNKTILSGDIGTIGVNTDNAYHVFYHPDTLKLDHTAILDGVTITGGNANGGFPHNNGGGMSNSSSSPTVTNVEFSGNEATNAGGGMSNGSSSPTVTNVVFRGNTASYNGGGMFNFSDSRPTVTDVAFRENTANNYGGGMYNISSSPIVTNVVFRENKAPYAGGGMYNDSSSPTVTNVEFSGNTANYGGGMSNEGNSRPTLTNVTMSGHTANGPAIYNRDSAASVPKIHNSIIVGNNGPAYNGTPTIKNSLIGDNQKGQLYDSAGKPVGQEYLITAIFKVHANKDYRLKAGSPAIDAGDKSYNNTQTDLDGNRRTQGNGIDLGAYEYQVSSYTVTFNSNGGSTVAQQTVRENTLISEPTPPTRAGYTFAGWYRDSGFTNAWDFTKDVVTANVTLYANWDATQVGTIIYVNEKSPAANGGDGTSWATAYKALQAALTAAGTGQEIWIAKGTYKPTKLSNSTNSRTASFQMKNGVKIYGGFVGNETTPAERDARNFKKNETILSGDIGRDGVNTDNVYHVFYHPDTLKLDHTAILDGVTIKEGHANGNSPHNTGGGMYNDSSSPTVTNVEFSGNKATTYGGGMFNINSRTTVTKVEFRGNEANFGGGMHNEGNSSPTVTDVAFRENTANNYGGGMSNGSSSPTVTNVVFRENTATLYGGGGMFNNNSTPTLINITMSGNTTNGAGMAAIYNFDSSSTPTIQNSIIVGNNGLAYNGTATIKNSLIGDGQKGQLYDSAGVSEGKDHQIEDIFLDHANKDYRLKAGSPAIDAGDKSYNNTQTDLDGNRRTQGNGIDLGAYEYQVSSYTVTFDSNGGSTVDPLSVPENTLISEPTPAPTKTGYTFGGWYKEASYTNEWNFMTDVVKGDMKLYANWKANTQTITFDSTGGTPIADMVITYDSLIQAPTPPTKTGYTFGGWYKEAAYTTLWNFTVDRVENDVTLYAKWTPNPPTPPIPTYSVSYNGNGETGGQAPSSASYKENTTVTVAGNTGNLVNPNHIFTGWNTEADGTGTAYAAGATFQMGKANITLYAQWKVIPTYSVTYNGNGATGGQVPTSATHEENATVTVQGNTGNLVKSNHIFTGWNTQANGKGTAYAAGATFQMGEANVTLYAQWKTIPTYTVTYNGNGATSGQVPPSASYEENATVTVQGNSSNLVKPNHTFTGWNTQSDGTGIAYTTGATFQMGKANVILYAQWKVNPPTPGGDTTPPPTSSDDNTYSPPTTVKITLHSNDGTIIEPINITYNTKVSDLPVPLRAGFRFEGWYEDEALTKRWADGAFVRENISLYAKWTALPAVDPEPETPQEPQPPTSPQPTVTFDDVEQHWAQEMIEELTTRGIIQGYEDGTFRPNAPISRMHVAALLTRAFPFDNVREGNGFSDVSPAHPYYEAILTLQQAGIIDGANGAFSPKENMTRAELAKVLVGVLGLTPAGTASFNDVASTHWSTGYIAVLEREGIALGDNGNYSPNDPVTRAQFVTFLYRVLNQ